jgi:hypothetical protein
MMSEHPSDERDDALLAQLRSALTRIDPVPDPVLEAARAAVEFRDLDAQLAELLRDTADEEPELAGVRGVVGRLLTFGLGDRYVELEVANEGDQRTITGYVVPASAGELIAESSGAPVNARLDDQGRFHLSGLRRGPVRLRFVLPEESLLTPWTGI